MTSNYPSDVPPVNLQGVGVPATDDLSTAGADEWRTDATDMNSGHSDTKEQVKEQASGLAQGASEAGQHVAGVAKDETKRVASEAGAQAKNLLHQVSGEVRSQASTQQGRLAEGLRAVGASLTDMAEGRASSGVATDFVHQAAQRTDSIARWLEEREPGDLLDEAKEFARRRPGVFIAIAAGAGILAGRLTKALASSAADEKAATSRSSSSYSGTTQSPERVGIVSPDVVTPGVGSAGLVDDPFVEGSGLSQSRAGGAPLGGGLS